MAPALGRLQRLLRPQRADGAGRRDHAHDWARFFDADEPVHALVAEHEGRLVGLVHYLFHRSTTLLGPTCYLQDLFTDAALRGRGVGRALIAAVNERARAEGAERVYWMTHETNATAMKLYDQVAEKPGFVIYRQVLG
jgi:GNAT superfamily N-acetyltransferase